MKKENIFLACCFWMLLSSCSPRILTNVMVIYRPVPVDSVRVFMPGEVVPNSAERIGEVAIVDRGTTTKCSYEYVVQQAREETARNGGNGLLITEHVTPSVWRSSCHQIAGWMLYLKDLEIDSSVPNTLMESLEETRQGYEKQRERGKVPRNTINVDFGYGWITSKIYTPSGVYKSKGGLEWKIEYDHVFRGGIGFGLQYMGYKTDFPYGESLNLTYIGPSFVGRHRTANWLFKYGIGAGYFGYNDNNRYKTSSVGFSVNLGLEYMFTPNLGLAVSFNTHSARLKSPEGTELPEDEVSGIAKIGLQGGLRVYF